MERIRADGDGGLGPLNRLTSVRSLALSWREEDTVSLLPLRPMLGRLTSLTFSGTFCGSVPEGVSALKCCSELRSLVGICSCLVLQYVLLLPQLTRLEASLSSEEDDEPSGGLALLPDQVAAASSPWHKYEGSLQHLAVSGLYSCVEATSLLPLGVLTRLCSLVLDGLPCVAHDMQWLGQLTQLTQLEMTWDEDDEDACPDFAPISALVRLQRLKICCGSGLDAAASSLPPALSCLASFQAQAATQATAGIASVPAAAEPAVLQHVVLDCQMSTAAAAAALACHAGLTHIDLQSCLELTRTSLRPLGRLRQLLYLAVAASRYAPPAVEASLLEDLVGCSALRQLQLSWLDCTSGLRLPEEMLARLTYISLQWCSGLPPEALAALRSRTGLTVHHQKPWQGEQDAKAQVCLCVVPRSRVRWVGGSVLRQGLAGLCEHAHTLE